MTRGRALPLVVLAAVASGCGGSTPAAPSQTPSNPNRVVITAAGAVSPVEIVVSPGSRVLFVNDDSRRHHMASDPHPDHGTCPELNAVGVLQPGQSRETANLVTARTCTYHDHDNPDSASLKGRIVIR